LTGKAPDGGLIRAPGAAGRAGGQMVFEFRLQKEHPAAPVGEQHPALSLIAGHDLTS
jgi:hypothetical protein